MSKLPSKGGPKMLSFLIFVSAFLSSVSAESDIKRIFRRAGQRLAERHGTTINPRALSSGFCFSRDDYTENKDKCIDEPASVSSIYFHQCSSDLHTTPTMIWLHGSIN